MKNKYTVGAAIIVKDEAKSIASAIRSLQPYCDQITIVDTGSTDGTQSICSRLGVELWHFEWNGSFSDARNFALNHVRADWVIALDADEILDGESFARQSFFMENNSIGGLSVIIRNALSEDSNEYNSKHRYTRIFRSDSHIKYSGKIHEQISDSIRERGYDIVESDIMIDHFGYIDPSDEKIERNRQLLNEELKVDNDPRMKYHLADTEFAAGNFDVARKLYVSVIDSDDLSLNQNERVKIRLGQIALKKDSFDDVGKYLDFESSDTDLEGLRKFVLGTALLLQNKYAEALELLKAEEVKKSSLADQQIVDNAVRSLEIALGKSV